MIASLVALLALLVAAQGVREQRTQLTGATFLPNCSAVDALPHSQVKELRASLQMWQYNMRRVRELHEFINKKENPDKEAHMITAYHTPESLEELRAEVEQRKRAEDEYRGKAEDIMVALREQSRVPHWANAFWASACLLGPLDPLLYPHLPKIALGLEYYKRPHMIDKLMERMRGLFLESMIRAELLVNVDSLSEGDKWAELAKTRAGIPSLDIVPVFSANVHETRAYNRLVRMSRAPIIVLLQDDDYPPSDPKWIQNILAVFDKYPKLGAVGMQAFRWCIHNFNNEYQGAFSFKDPQLDIKMNFVAVADFAPLAVRKAAYEDVGLLDEGTSDPGMCGIYGDWELTTRMWASGWQVAYMDVVGRDRDTEAESGTHTPENGLKCWGRQMAAGAGVFHNRFGDPDKPFVQATCEEARKANLELLEYMPDRPCPWGDGKCTKAALEG